MWFLLGCAVTPDPETVDSATEGGDTAEDVVVLPDGDSIVELGGWVIDGMGTPETTAVLQLDERYAAVCLGTMPAAIFDLADETTPTKLDDLDFEPPAGGFRCQHLAYDGSDLLLASHHGDETSPAWLGLTSVADPTANVGLAGWSGAEVEALAIAGTDAYVAAHHDGLLRFDLSERNLDRMEVVEGVGGNVNAVAVRGGRVAAGTVEGDVYVSNGSDWDIYTVSGPVRDLEWLADDTLVAACGSDGVDRLDLSAGTVGAHADIAGTALDLTVLASGELALAGWADIHVFDADLELLGTEAPPDGTAIALAVSSFGSDFLVGQWKGLALLRFDPTVSGPELRLDPAPYDLGVVESGETATQVVAVYNDGPKPLTVGVSSSVAELTVDPASFSVAPWERESFEATWSSPGGELRGNLTITTNDPDEPLVERPMYANRPGAGVGDTVPEFAYVALDSVEEFRSLELGQPALLSYFATF